MKPIVSLIATGGTIAMKMDPVTRAPVPAISAEDLLAMLPGLDGSFHIESQDLFNLPSSYMDPSRWEQLARAVQSTLERGDVAGVVVTHGTDTLEETAYWLDLTVGSDKPVVMVGAQRHAASPDSDGPRNLADALRIAADPGARNKGVMVAMNGRIHAARHARKTHTSNVETFRSGEFGPIGTVGTDRITFSCAPLRRQCLAPGSGPMPRVDIVAAYGGADGDLLRHAVERGAEGIVVQALGMGNLNASMFDAVRHALANGVAVVIASRVPEGPTAAHYGYVGGGTTLANAGAVMAGDLQPPKARILLMLLLQKGVKDRHALQAAFDGTGLP